jgi:hypothetical protein
VKQTGNNLEYSETNGKYRGLGNTDTMRFKELIMKESKRRYEIDAFSGPNFHSDFVDMKAHRMKMPAKDVS